MPTENGVDTVSAGKLAELKSNGHSFVSLRPPNLATCTRKEAREYFENTYQLEEGLFSALKDESYFYTCPDRLRLPLVFYLAHTATLYVNKLMMAGLIKERVDRHFETMFETGVDEMSWDDTENYRMGGSYKWPSIEKVMDYRKKVKAMVIEVIENAPLSLPVTKDHPWWSLFMGFEHERIHIETSSVLIRQLPVDFLRCPPGWRYAPSAASSPVGKNHLIKVPEVEVTFGKPSDFPTYGWDNEYGLRNIRVPSFEASQYLISNREYLQFVEADGYLRQNYWTDEGWKWLQFRQAKHPLFWVCHEGCKSNCGSALANYSHCNLTPPLNDQTEPQYRYRAMYDVIDMPWDWPVDVNYHEAKAYCRWKGPNYRLPTEAEHHAMRGEEPPCMKIETDPICCKDTNCCNFNFQYGSSTPVNFYPPNSRGFYDLYGNVWECLEDHFNGLPGFETNFLYDDYSSSSFDGRHNMIQGGSWVSTGAGASRFARYAFRRHFYQHMGFRIIRSLSSATAIPINLCDCTVFIQGVGVAENPVVVQGIDEKESYLPTLNEQFHFDKEIPCQNYVMITMGKEVDYNQPLVQYCQKLLASLGVETESALVAGCGAGYSVFQLATFFNKVVGVDYGGRLLDVAVQLQKKGAAVCGEVTIPLPLTAEKIRTDNVIFKQLTWFPNELEGFNFILFEFLDRLMEPKGWLSKLWEMISDNGILVISAGEKWTTDVLDTYIGQWFELIEVSTIYGKIVSSWQLKKN